jgi:acyl-CoA synthetase (AMP-forming)/AMP-acid ligase II
MVRAAVSAHAPIATSSVARSEAESAVAVRAPHDTLVAAFEAAAIAHAPAFSLHGAKGVVAKSTSQALEAAWRWSKLLASRGVARGDRVPLLLPTSHAFLEAMLGAMLIGAVPVPLAVPMTFGGVERYLANLAAIVDDCGARVLVTYPRIRDAVAKDPVLCLALGNVVGESDLDGVARTTVLAPALGGGDPAFLQYTSGTTGRPKGAVISHRALVSNAFAIAHGLGLGSRDVGVSWLPLFHDMGLIGVLLTSICHPYPLHVMTPESFVMSPRRWLDLLARVRGTVSAAPNFAYEMCVARASDATDVRLEQWRLALNGAEPVRASTARRFHASFAETGLPTDATMPVYGMAEATLAVTFPALDEKLETIAIDRVALERDGRAVRSNASDAHEAVSVGRPVAGMRVTIVSDAGRVVPEETIGAVRVAGLSLMDGYYRDDARSAEALSGGWLRTGDLGFMRGGRLFITGRAKELIIKAGRNIHPHDVERVAEQVAGVRVAGVAAFGHANADTGTEDIVVVAETTSSDVEGRAQIAKEVRAELLSVLGVKADHVRVCAVGAVPRTTSGKIRRGDCARRFAAGELG